MLEGGVRGFAYPSGMAATGSALSLLKSGDHLIAANDLYGGTWRYLSQVLPQQGIDVDFIDPTDLKAVAAAITNRTRALFLETPSNPLFQITDLRAMVALAKKHNLLTFLDNTFMTPLLCRPLDLGIDVVIHSATKFLGGHSDILAGLATTADPIIGKRLKQFQNAFGAVLAPFDSFLLSRGIQKIFKVNGIVFVGHSFCRRFGFLLRPRFADQLAFDAIDRSRISGAPSLACLARDVSMVAQRFREGFEFGWEIDHMIGRLFELPRIAPRQNARA